MSDGDSAASLVEAVELVLASDSRISALVGGDDGRALVNSGALRVLIEQVRGLDAEPGLADEGLWPFVNGVRFDRMGERDDFVGMGAYLTRPFLVLAEDEFGNGWAAELDSDRERVTNVLYVDHDGSSIELLSSGLSSFLATLASEIRQRELNATVGASRTAAVVPDPSSPTGYVLELTEPGTGIGAAAVDLDSRLPDRLAWPATPPGRLRRALGSLMDRLR